MTRARLLVFDLDGTLVDTLDDLTDAANRLLHRLGLPDVAPDAVRTMIGDGVPALVRRVLHARGQGATTAQIDAFAADYAAHAAERSTLFPGMADALERLRAAGWKLAVCTNKPEQAARALLQALSVDGLFDAIGAGDSFAARKPDPAHLLGTIRLAGGAPERSVMLGDHRNDVEAAMGAGVCCLFAGWGYGSPAMAEGADGVAERVAQVPELAAALLGQ